MARIIENLLSFGYEVRRLQSDLPGPQCVGRSCRSERVEESEQDRQGGPPAEKLIHEAASFADDLRRHQDEPLHEGPEVHAQHTFSVGLVFCA